MSLTAVLVLGLVSVDLRAEGPEGPSRGDACVRFAVPVPRGRLARPEDARLLDLRGLALPGAFSASARWPDGSVMFLLVDGRTGLDARGRGRLFLEYGRGVEPVEFPSALRSGAIQPSQPLRRSRPAEDGSPLSRGRSEVETGAARFRLSRDGISAESPGCAFDIEPGGPLEDIELEDSSPLRVSYRTRSGKSSLRAEFFAGLPLVRLRAHGRGRVKVRVRGGFGAVSFGCRDRVLTAPTEVGFFEQRERLVCWREFPLRAEGWIAARGKDGVLVAGFRPVEGGRWEYDARKGEIVLKPSGAAWEAMFSLHEPDADVKALRARFFDLSLTTLSLEPAEATSTGAFGKLAPVSAAAEVIEEAIDDALKPGRPELGAWACEQFLRTGSRKYFELARWCAEEVLRGARPKGWELAVARYWSLTGDERARSVLFSKEAGEKLPLLLSRYLITGTRDDRDRAARRVQAISKELLSGRGLFGADERPPGELERSGEAWALSFWADLFGDRPASRALVLRARAARERGAGWEQGFSDLVLQAFAFRRTRESVFLEAILLTSSALSDAPDEILRATVPGLAQASFCLEKFDEIMRPVPPRRPRREDESRFKGRGRASWEELLNEEP